MPSPIKRRKTKAEQVFRKSAVGRLRWSYQAISSCKNSRFPCDEIASLTMTEISKTWYTVSHYPGFVQRSDYWVYWQLPTCLCISEWILLSWGRRVGKLTEVTLKKGSSNLSISVLYNILVFLTKHTQHLSNFIAKSEMERGFLVCFWKGFC